MKDLKKRFVSDIKIPINIFEDEYWDYYLDLYEDKFNSRTLWTKLLDSINKEYGEGGEHKFLADFYKVRENMINFIKTSEGYKEFSNIKIPQIQYPQQSGKDIYKDTNNGKTFISIDLKKANLQILDDFIDFGEGISIDDVWNSWVKSLTEGKDTLSWYVPISKYIRQVVFGNCNPKRQISLEKRKLWEEGAKKALEGNENSLTLISLNSDEVIFEPVSSSFDINNIKIGKIDVKIEKFVLGMKKFKTITGNTITIYSKTNEKGEVSWKGINKNYYAQIYELVNGIAPDKLDRDLMFYNEKDLAKFIGRIQEIK